MKFRKEKKRLTMTCRVDDSVIIGEKLVQRIINSELGSPLDRKTREVSEKATGRKRKGGERGKRKRTIAGQKTFALSRRMSS